MEDWQEVLDTFILQARTKNLKTASYPKEFSDLKLRVSFGMGVPARIPWIAFVASEMKVSNGFYPVYLYYKEHETLVLSYGLSETSEYDGGWSNDIVNSAVAIGDFFEQDVPRYKNSLVFKAYKIHVNGKKVNYSEGTTLLPKKRIESDLKKILNQYKKLVSLEIQDEDSPLNQGLFYMEKHLEDFLIHNWKSTGLGKRFDLIIEDGELISQQYRTEIGFIDILAKDKKDGSYVVIELKKNQTSDDTVGQLARYMGWIKKNKNDGNVKGIIIAGEFDKKLEYAMGVVDNIEVYLYQISFSLDEFKGL